MSYVVDTTVKGTAWSITINNPSQDDIDATNNVAGWKDFVSFEGQNEVGENGTPHIQGFLRTKSCRFSAVKKYFSRAHIELAKNTTALTKYVHKEETKVSDLQGVKFATVSTLNSYITKLWDITKYKNHVYTMIMAMKEEYGEKNTGMNMLDEITNCLITEGYYGVEYISSNPATRGAWNKYWEAMVRREVAKNSTL